MLDDGQVESLWVSKQLGRPVIKAFNNILAFSLAHLSYAKGASTRLAIAVAGNDELSKKTVMGLINEIGFDAIDSGSLEESWRQQPSTPSYCCYWNAVEMKEALLSAVKGQATHKRDRLPKHLAALGINPSHADIIALNRVVNCGT